MKFSTLTKVGFALATVVGAIALSACTPSNPTYMTYYTDASCRYFYVDSLGNKVYDGRVDDNFAGLKMMQASDGRWYYQDSFGNRIYKSKRCK
jgi:hypothetical protein